MAIDGHDGHQAKRRSLVQNNCMEMIYLCIYIYTHAWRFVIVYVYFMFSDLSDFHFHM